MVALRGAQHNAITKGQPFNGYEDVADTNSASRETTLFRRAFDEDRDIDGSEEKYVESCSMECATDACLSSDVGANTPSTSGISDEWIFVGLADEPFPPTAGSDDWKRDHVIEVESQPDSPSINLSILPSISGYPELSADVHSFWNELPEDLAPNPSCSMDEIEDSLMDYASRLELYYGATPLFAPSVPKPVASPTNDGPRQDDLGRQMPYSLVRYVADNDPFERFMAGNLQDCDSSIEVISSSQEPPLVRTPTNSTYISSTIGANPPVCKVPDRPPPPDLPVTHETNYYLSDSGRSSKESRCESLTNYYAAEYITSVLGDLQDLHPDNIFVGGSSQRGVPWELQV